MEDLIKAGLRNKKEIELSATSVIDLKAELLKKQEEYERHKQRIGTDSHSIPTSQLTKLKVAWKS